MGFKNNKKKDNLLIKNNDHDKSDNPFFQINLLCTGEPFLCKIDVTNKQLPFFFSVSQRVKDRDGKFVLLKRMPDDIQLFFSMQTKEPNANNHQIVIYEQIIHVYNQFHRFKKFQEIKEVRLLNDKQKSNEQIQQ